MAQTHYIDIHVCRSTKEDTEWMVSSIMKGLHQAIVQECGNGDASRRQDKISVSFPSAEPANRYTEKMKQGGVIRVFGDRDALGRLMRSPGIFRFIHGEQVEISTVPAAAGRHVFKRFQKHGKFSPSVAKRRALRAAKRGEPVPNETGPKSIGLVAGFVFSMEVYSATDGLPFLLTVERKPCTGADNGLFNSYGLSAGGSVPVF